MLPTQASQGQTKLTLGEGREETGEGASQAPRSQRGWRRTAGEASGTEVTPARGSGMEQHPREGFPAPAETVLLAVITGPLPHTSQAIMIRDLERALHCPQPESGSYLRRPSEMPPNPLSQCFQLNRNCPLSPTM